MQKPNPNLVEPFKVYAGHFSPALRSEAPTCQAHEIIYAESCDRYVTVFYRRTGDDKVRSMMLDSRVTLDSLVRTHGSGFFKPSRRHLINTQFITAAFPTSPTEFGCSMEGVSAVIHVSKRQVKELKKLRKDVQ